MDYSFIISFLSFLLVLTPIVFIHELGHFFVARKFDVHVEIFSVGFGPVLLSKLDKLLAAIVAFLHIFDMYDSIDISTILPNHLYG